MKKKILPCSAFFYVAIALIVTFVFGCKREETSAKDEKSNDHLVVTATFYPMYIMLLNITENIPDIELKLLAPAETGCLHDYQLSTADMKTIISSDVIVANGAGMEDFLEKVLESQKNCPIIEAAQGYPLLEDNPHVWVSLKGAMYEVDHIATALSELDPDHQALYQNNAKTYIQKLQNLYDKMNNLLTSFSDIPIVTFHEAFPYFAQDFGLHIVENVETDHGHEPSPKELSELIQELTQLKKDGKKPVLFVEKDQTTDSADIISSEADIPLYYLNSTVTGELDQDAYIRAMEYNLEEMLKAFR